MMTMIAGVGLNRRRPSEIGTLRAADIRRWVGRDLRILRVTTAQSQRRMASRCGISQSFESQVERGTGNASLEVLAALAEEALFRGYVLQTGEVVLSGAARELLTNEAMKRAYLGEV